MGTSIPHMVRQTRPAQSAPVLFLPSRLGGGNSLLSVFEVGKFREKINDYPFLIEESYDTCASATSFASSIPSNLLSKTIYHLLYLCHVQQTNLLVYL